MWDDQLRHKNEQLSSAQQRFQQLTLALRQMQEQLQAQKILMQQQLTAQQQQVAQLQQQGINVNSAQMSGSQRVNGFGSRSAAAIASNPFSMNVSPSVMQSANAAAAAAVALNDSSLFEDPFPAYAQRATDFFSTKVHEPEDIIEPDMTTPMFNQVNTENLELTWEFLMRKS